MTPIAECVTGIRNDATRNTCSFSWNGLADSNHILNHIPSNWGRYSVTYTTHSEHHLPTNFAISDIHGSKQTIYLKPDLFLPKPDTLMLRNNTSSTSQQAYSSVATRTSSKTHIHQPTFPSTNRPYGSVSMDANSEVTKAVGDMMRVWGVVYRLVVYYAMEKVYDTTIGSSFAWRQIYNLIIMYFHMRRLDTHTTLSDTEVPLLEYKYDDTVSFDLQSYERTSVWHLKEYIRSSNIVGSNAESNHAHAITHHIPPTLIRLEDWGVMDRGVDERIIVVVSSDDAALIDDGSHYIIGITQHVHNHHYKSIHPSQRLRGNIALTSSSSNGGYGYCLALLDPYLLEDGERLNLPRNHMTTDTIDAPMHDIGTQLDTKQYVIAQQFSEEYGESAIWKPAWKQSIMDIDMVLTVESYGYDNSILKSIDIEQEDVESSAILCLSDTGSMTHYGNLNGPCLYNIASRGATQIYTWSDTLTGYESDTWLDILYGPQLARVDDEYVNNACCQRHMRDYPAHHTSLFDRYDRYILRDIEDIFDVRMPLCARLIRYVHVPTLLMAIMVL